MGIDDKIMLSLVSIYVLFNIKKIYYLILFGWQEIGAKRTLAIIGFVATFIGGVLSSFFAIQYFWIFRWVFILYIVAFIIYRLVWGTRYYDKEG